MTAKTTGLPVVGMVGAGQLARMTHQAAISLGLTLRVLADNADDGAALVTPDVEIGAASDRGGGGAVREVLRRRHLRPRARSE